MAIDYFTLAEFRTLPDMSSVASYSDAAVESAAAFITAVIEREVDASFVARTVTDESHDGGGYAVVLRRPFVLSVTSATEDGVAVTDTLRVRNGVVRKFTAGTYTPLLWAEGTGNVAVTYSAGYSSTPPSDIKEAAMWGTRARLLDTASNATVTDRKRSVTNTEGGTTEYVIAGADRPTGYPSVDAVIIGWRNRLNNFGFA